jgi:hypothetical protein
LFSLPPVLLLPPLLLLLLLLQVSDSFPFKWINKKWKEGFYVTSMATSHTRWAVVMSRNAGFVDQVRPSALPTSCVDCCSKFVRFLGLGPGDDYEAVGACLAAYLAAKSVWDLQVCMDT